MSPLDPQLEVNVEALVHRAGCPVVGSVDDSDWCLPVQPFIAFARLFGDWSPDEIMAAMDTYAVARGGQRVPVRTTRETMVDMSRRFRRRPRLARREVWMVPMPARDVEAQLTSTVVFIPAWNEEQSLPGVLAEAHGTLPDADLLVIDDGSTDNTAAVARAAGAEVVSFDTNRGLKEGIAEGYRQALVRGYEYCGRLDADGQHPAAELKRMLEIVQRDECDVAIGSRFLPGSGEYTPTPERVFGTSLLRLLMRLRLGQAISDGTSGLYAVNRNALALLADTYVCEAPEVEALVRITDAKLRLLEVPVQMRQREHGESSFRGRRAVELVVTIGLTLFAGELFRRRRAKRKSWPWRS